MCLLQDSINIKEGKREVENILLQQYQGQSYVCTVIHDHVFYYPRLRGRRVQYLVCVCVCLCVTTKLRNINKLQVTNLVITKSGSLQDRQVLASKRGSSSI